MGAAQLHAVTDAGGDGPVVVLGHGLGGDQTQWGPIAPVEGRSAHVAAPAVVTAAFEAFALREAR